MTRAPRDPAFDSSLALMREGYTFLPKRFGHFGTELFTLRLLGKPAVAIHGREAAALFYDETKLKREGAVPRRVVTSLFGAGGVQGLDDEAHRRRKSAFLSVLSREGVTRLLQVIGEEWQRAARAWAARSEVVLFDEAQLLLTRAACRWAGVPLAASEERSRAQDLGRMVEAFGGVGPRLWRGKLSRLRSERWVTELVLAARRGELGVSGGGALRAFSEHTDEQGRLLPARVAAVEVLNVIRPTAAIAWYVCFAALALRAHSELGAPLEAAQPFEPGGFTERVAQEIRRFYPFTPFLGAKVRTPFEWRGHSFTTGTLVLLDVYGTHHDARLWPEPEQLDPDRFSGTASKDPAFIPQGGGDELGHRCAGEALTRYTLQLALHFLTRRIRYEVPSQQDLRVDLRRMPTLPKSGFQLRRVEATQSLDDPVPLPPLTSRPTTLT